MPDIPGSPLLSTPKQVLELEAKVRDAEHNAKELNKTIRSLREEVC